MSTTKELFKKVVVGLNEVIEKGEVVVDGEGVAHKNHAAPAYFAQAINLLKMVGETGQADKPTIAEKLKTLAVPFTADDADEAMRH
jgi:hypothetical protein